MANRLRITKDDALEKMYALSDELFALNHIQYDLSDQRSIYEAGTYYDNNGYAIKVKIGVQEIEHPKQSFIKRRNPIISDKDFTQIIINMYHEYTHCIQKNQTFRQENINEYERQQMIHELACIDNPEYYKDNSNYSKDANEIQAEYYGVRSAYNYMCDAFSETSPEYIESVILEIVNEKMMYSTYFLKQTELFTSLDDVYTAFEDAYEKSFTAEQLYFVNQTPTNDRVKLYMQDHDDAKEAYPSFSDKKDKDSCIAAINISLHPAWQKHYPELKNMDLSYETWVTKPYQVIKNKKSPAQLRQEQLEAEIEVFRHRNRSAEADELLSAIQMPEEDTKEISDDNNDYIP